MDRMSRDRWTAALRSGAYKQGFSQLRSSDGEAHCCLGVLCEIAGIKIYDGYACVPNSEDGYEPIHSLIGKPATGTLYALNDNRVPFSEIADWIERNL